MTTRPESSPGLWRRGSCRRTFKQLAHEVPPKDMARTRAAPAAPLKMERVAGGRRGVLELSVESATVYRLAAARRDCAPFFRRCLSLGFS